MRFVPEDDLKFGYLFFPITIGIVDMSPQLSAVGGYHEKNTAVDIFAY